MDSFPENLKNLALFRKFISHIEVSWPEFLQRRRERLVQGERNDGTSEKVAENILDDFFTVALDWTLKDLNNQVQFADMVLTTNGLKRLVVEVKRPGSLSWDTPSLVRALEQARRYADEQRISTIVVSDGILFYAADIVNGGLRDRVRMRLDIAIYSPNAWWVSVDGIYRTPELLPDPESSVLEQVQTTVAENSEFETAPKLMHSKYKIPAEYFAYVGDASDPKTWKLPCWLTNGDVDTGRLPGAIRAVVSTYRGARVTIPEKAVPDVLVRLGKAAAKARKLPNQTPNPQLSYQQLYDTLYQINRLDEVFSDL